MNSLTELLLNVLEESGTLCGVDTTQDRKTILSRIKDEGLEFLTLTLPTFGKDFERSLDLEVVDSSLFAPFKRLRDEALPVFLGGFLGLIFDKVTGRILDDVQCREAIDAIRCVRQISGLLSKLEGACSPKREAAALSRFIENDSYVRYMDKQRTPHMMSKFLTMSHVLFGGVFRSVQSDVAEMRINPVHGPGVTADRLLGNRKWDPSKHTWPDTLDELFPRWRYAYSSGSLYLEAVMSGVEWPGTEIPVKVITVPKTPKSPRIIAVEPTAMQYMQQGLMGSFYDAINRFAIGRVMNWDSQMPNQQLARLGSLPLSRSDVKHHRDGGFATLDLSDASDLVSNRLVNHMLRDFPVLQDAVQATRSEMANVDDRTIVLSKFASMGSAMCFPIESIVFTIIAFMGIHEAYPQVPLRKLRSFFEGKVRVYGDDIIVPRRAAQSVVRLLEAFGLRVNRGKSFWTGMFRESCGEDYFAGTNVSYVKCRHELPNPQKARTSQVSEIVSAVALRNNLFVRGYTETASWLDNILLKCLDGVFPVVKQTSAALGRVHFDESFETHRMHPDHHVPQVKAWVVSGSSPSSRSSDEGNLMKVLSKRSGDPIPDPQHLLRAGRPSALRIKQKWVNSF
jgi:hypothetical protein